MLRLLAGGAAAFLVSAPLVEVATLTSSSSSGVGDAVAVEGDLIVAGATDAPVGGAAYVYQRGTGPWTPGTEVAELQASDRRGGAMFGTSVGLSGDTIVVGADAARSGGQNTGAAYVFVEPAGGWASMTQLAKLTHRGGISNDSFGRSVAISGDTIVVGARGVDVGGVSNRGSAYVYVRPAGGWVGMAETAILSPTDATGEFGSAVAIDGDTIIVGALSDDSGGITNRGAAYVFEKPAGGWTGEVHETAKLLASNPGFAHFFGGAVDIDGDTVVVGASNAGVEGMAYVFQEPSTGWANDTENAQLTGDFGPPTDFGETVSVRNDTIAVGARGGGCYVFERPGNGWESATEDQRIIGNTAATGGGVVVTGSPTVGRVRVFEYVFDPPVLSGVAPSPVPNYSPIQIDVVVNGQGLHTASALTLGAQDLPILLKSPGSLTFAVPNGFPIGAHDVVVENIAGGSNALSLDVEGVHPSVLLPVGVHPTGQTQTYSVYTDKQWNVLYLLSAVNGTTALPGIVSFTIGGGLFGNLVPVVTVAADGGGLAELPVTMPPGLPLPLSLFWQCMTYDPAVPLGLQVPIETSNAISVLTLF